MANEILVIPEESLEEVIYILRIGMNGYNAFLKHEQLATKVHLDTLNKLNDWCNEMEEYLYKDD